MSILCNDMKVRVSSVLNRDTKQYGKQMMFDQNEDTCWNSDQGDIQWLKIRLGKSYDVTTNYELILQFQGGFSCRECVINALDEKSKIIAATKCYPEDVNSKQVFKLKFMLESSAANQEAVEMKLLEINFQHTTDFFGRVTIYYIDIIQSDK
ncbi:unnamed protein product [Clavelina lepadiformis]|uniref:F5/8 type C domain-containing protein n=1 Tax=Clavelina lepadiformis TaxID=159417 RepID=A0ABP0H3R8_CLALP